MRIQVAEQGGMRARYKKYETYFSTLGFTFTKEFVDQITYNAPNSLIRITESFDSFEATYMVELNSTRLKASRNFDNGTDPLVVFTILKANLK